MSLTEHVIGKGPHHRPGCRSLVERLNFKYQSGHGPALPMLLIENS